MNIKNSKRDDGSDNRRRLLMALNRYIEGTGRARTPELSRQDAAVLTAIDWGEKHPECRLNQTQLGKLLQIGRGQLSTRLNKSLRNKGFCEPLDEEQKRRQGLDGNNRNFFRLTTKGVRALEAHAQVMFQLPSKVAEEMLGTPEYQAITGRIDEILRRELIAKFQEVRES